MSAPHDLPRWADVGLIPLINLLAALVVSGIVVAFIGENPIEAMMVMIKGAFVYKGSLGYTLYYATNFIFTGLAVAVAFHAMLFNIGGEGQAYLGGLGAGLVCLMFDSVLPAIVLLPLAIMAAASLGAVWGLFPDISGETRQSHCDYYDHVQFSRRLDYGLASGWGLKAPGQMSPETRVFSDNATLPFIHEIANAIGWEVARSPLNLSFVVALLACVGVWVLIWRSRLGYAIRATGHSAKAAEYAGISVSRVLIITMAISGGLAGMMAINEILGVQHRIVLNFTSGYGFTGIAVALMGRNHPVGIILASLLFGALYQGGAELDFEFSTITREMVLLIQGLIILFSGGLAYMFNKPLARLLAMMLRENHQPEARHG